MSKEKSKKRGIGKFLAGAAVGAGLGILFAPKKGSETRKDLKKGYKKITNKVKDIEKEDVEEFIRDAKNEIEAELRDLSKEKILSKARDKAREIKIRCDEILEMATVAGNKALEKGVSDFKKETVKVLKEIINKLEA